MSVIAQILNGTNLNRDAGFSSLVSSLLVEGVRSNFGNDLAITLNQCDIGMAFIECTRTATTPNEVFLIPVWVDVPEVIDTSGNGYIIIEVDQAKINDGSANSVDGTGIATVKKVSVLPSTNYLELASLASGVITDTRVPIAIDIDSLTANGLIADSLLEKTGSNGVLIDEILCNDGYFDMVERADPATPASTHWRLFFKTDGLYIIDDAGAVLKAQTGGVVTAQKAEASAGNGELFENTDEDNRLSWKDSGGTVYNPVTDAKGGFISKTVGQTDVTANQDTTITTKGSAKLIKLRVVLENNNKLGATGEIVYEGTVHKYTYGLSGIWTGNITAREIGANGTDANRVGFMQNTPRTFQDPHTAGANRQDIVISVSSITSTGVVIRVANTKVGTGGTTNTFVDVGYEIIV